MVIRRVRPFSVARVAGILYALLGLIIGAIMSLIALVAGGAMADANPEMPRLFGVIFGVGAIVILPIFYGVLGFIMTAIMAALYNLAAGIVGGIEIETQ